MILAPSELLLAQALLPAVSTLVWTRVGMSADTAGRSACATFRVEIA